MARSNWKIFIESEDFEATEEPSIAWSSSKELEGSAKEASGSEIWGNPRGHVLKDDYS